MSLGRGQRYCTTPHQCDSCGLHIAVGQLEIYRRGYWIHATCAPGGDE